MQVINSRSELTFMALHHIFFFACKVKEIPLIPQNTPCFVPCSTSLEALNNIQLAHNQSSVYKLLHDLYDTFKNLNSCYKTDNE